MSLDEMKKIAIRLTEVTSILLMGFLLTELLLWPIYEKYGIPFTGNVWVNWLGVSYLLFVAYTLIVGLYILKKSLLFKKRRTSILFWLLFVASNYVVFIPFIKGENPF